MQASRDMQEQLGREVAPITCAVEVELPPKEAFELFTAGMSGWWPLERLSIAADTHEGRVTATSVTVEPRVGGAVLERMSDGSSAPWGQVLVWEPPSRFAITWKPNLEDGPFTEVEVRFEDAGAGRTRVQLEHRGWERLGADAHEKSQAYAHGWPGVLDLYRAASQT